MVTENTTQKHLFINFVSTFPFMVSTFLIGGDCLILYWSRIFGDKFRNLCVDKIVIERLSV